MDVFHEMNLKAENLEELNKKIEDAYCYGYEKVGEIKKEGDLLVQKIYRPY